VGESRVLNILGPKGTLGLGPHESPEGPKKSKEHEKAPKTIKKLLADAQRIGAEQEDKAKKAAEKKTAELKAAEKSAKKSKASQERPQLGKEPEGEPVKKKPRIEAARSYLKSIGSAVKGIPIHPEPLSMITSEYSLRSAEEEAVPHHPSPGGVPVLCNEDVLTAQHAACGLRCDSSVHGWGRTGSDRPS
jgi:hypothetical protein